MKTSPGEAADTETGLPRLRSWRAVYVCVVASFCVWLLGLLTLRFFFA